ncbi:DUF3858 domain-containing protein [Lacinutrix gracilariae]|uniref:DUF3858 domain-containing protein n=1 Tax=Lacinutrix gracilariae TaxID=1747198 RepID=A0ABW5K0S6_9FLAO
MKIKVLIITLLIAQFTFSQDFRFGKVSKAELEETQHAIEPEANAAVLYKEHRIYFEYVQGTGFVQNVEVHERIKIYNKDGYDYATKNIRLYNASNKYKDKLVGLKAYTYTLENGKIEDAKLKNDGIFEEENNKYWKTTKFTMPNIKDGCVVEYKYTIKSESINIDDIAFQKTIPINKYYFKVATPEYFGYKALINPKAVYYPKLDRSYEQSKITLGGFDRYSTGTKGSKYNSSAVDYQKNIIIADLTNIPALKDEVYVDNLNNYQAKLTLELEYIKYPNETANDFTTSWDKVTKTIYSNDDFGGQLNKKGYFKKDLDALLAGVTSPMEKAATIYNFVKTKVKSNGLIGYYTDLGVSKAYKEGAGNVADINLMLVAMLRYSGLNANPVLISTRSNGIPYTPTMDGFNYVIAAIEFQEGTVLLDASNLYATANVLPVNILNWKGRIVREDDSSAWLSLQPSQNSKQINYLNATINEDFSVSGKVRQQLTNHFALSHREDFNTYSDEQYVLSIEEGKGDIEVSNVDVKSKNEISKPILISYEYNLQNGIEEIADKLYFSSLLFLAPEENVFKQETREYPIDFTYPVSEKNVINIKIPQGYQVESLPESVKIQFNVNDGGFTYLVKQTNDLLQITTNLDINKTLIMPQEYVEFKKFFDLVVKKQTEQIVLKKV